MTDLASIDAENTPVSEPGRLPSVSVVIPCYNYGRFLTDAVESAVAQTGVAVRILIIDDASQDDSRAVGERLAEVHPEVEFRRHEVNRGHIATYNEGLLEWADRDYVVLLSADDLLAPGALQRATQVMEANPSVGMVHGYFEGLDAKDGAPVAQLPRRPSVTLTEGRAWLRRRCAEAVCVVTTPTVVVRRSVHVRVGGYKAELPHAGDMELWLRIATVSDIAYLGGATQAYYRFHDTSMSAAVYRDPLEDARQRKLVFDTFFAEHADLLSQLRVDPGDTYSRLASEQIWASCRAYERGLREPEIVEDRLAFARSVYPAWRELRAARALRRRERLGAETCHRTQMFIATAAVRKLHNMLWWRRLEAKGG